MLPDRASDSGPDDPIPAAWRDEIDEINELCRAIRDGYRDDPDRAYQERMARVDAIIAAARRAKEAL